MARHLNVPTRKFRRRGSDDPTAHFRSRTSSEDWRYRGACFGIDPDVMYPEHLAGVVEAKRVCGPCPVRAECLEYALVNDEDFGIWGGESALKRRKMRKARKARLTTTGPPRRRDPTGPPSRGAKGNVRRPSVA